MASISNTLNSSTAVIEIIDFLEKELRSQNIFYERERLSRDRVWLHQVIVNNPEIKYIRIVKSKPLGGTFVRRRFNYDAFLVKRNAIGTTVKVWWLYVVPVQK